MDPAYLAALKANARPVGPVQTQGKAKFVNGKYVLEGSKKGSKNQSWLSSIISESAGAGGAGAGAAAGAAIGAPFAGVGAIPGAIIGGVVGGFAGGFGGRAVENKVRDDEYRLGDSLKEGALSGAFGAVGPAWQGTRGLGALAKASGSKGTLRGAKILSGMSDDAARITAGKAIAKGGTKAGRAVGQGARTSEEIAAASRKGAQSLGDKFRASQRGIIPGDNGIGTKEAFSYNTALDNANKWFSGIGKSAQYTNAEDAVDALSKAYRAAPEASKQFGKANADDLAERFLQNIDDNPTLRGTLTGKNNKIVENLLDDAIKFGGKKNGDFVEFMSTRINPRYKKVSSGGSAGTVESQVLEAFRDAGKGIIDEKLVTRSGVNKQLSSIMGASKQLGKTITRDASAGAGQGLTLGRVLANVIGPGMDVAGRGLQQAGKVTKYTTPIAIGAGARAVANQALQPAAQDPTQEDGSQDSVYGGGGASDIMQDPTAQLGGVSEQPAQSAYTLEQAIADMQANPDAKSRKNIMDYYKFIQDAEKSGGTQLTAAEKKSQKQAQTAMQGLTQLKSLFSEAGGGKNRLPGIAGNIQGRLGANSKTDAYNRIRDSLTTSLARAFGETGVLTDQDREVYRQALPRLEDTPEEAAIKLQYLEDMLAGSSQSSETDYGTQADLNTILSQYGGQ